MPDNALTLSKPSQIKFLSVRQESKTPPSLLTQQTNFICCAISEGFSSRERLRRKRHNQARRGTKPDLQTNATKSVTS